MSSTGFFGLTYLGGGTQNPFHDKSVATKKFPFHDIPEEVYQQVFNQHVIGDKPLARQLKVNGEETIARATLGDMLKQLLQRQPSKMELDAWFTFLDFDSRSTMDAAEFWKGVAALRAFSSQPGSPTDYSSYDKKFLDGIKHKRVGYDPQRTLKGPILTSQEVGWHSKKCLGACIEKPFPLQATDVTKCEGRSLADYYGHITMM